MIHGRQTQSLATTYHDFLGTEMQYNSMIVCGEMSLYFLSTGTVINYFGKNDVTLMRHSSE